MSDNEKNKNIKNIHAIHSAKGGSGKSSFSFALANLLYGMYDLASANPDDWKPFDEKSKKILLFDADFKGTSFKSIFFQGEINKDKAIYIENVEKKTFDQLIFDKIFDLNNYITKCIVQNKDSNNNLKKYKLINICFSSEKYSSKKRFYYSKNHDNSEQLSVERFRDWFINLLNNISAVYNKDEFKDLIFDLSPSSDEYTETMLDTFRKVSSGGSPKYNFYHYVVVTDDSAHINATVEYICDLMSGSMRQEDNRKVIIVLNQIYDNKLFIRVNGTKDFSDTDDIINEIAVSIIKQIKSKLDKKLSKDKCKAITYLFLPFNQDYFIYSRKNSSDKLNTLDFPIRYLRDNVNFKNFDNFNNKFIKIITGEGEQDE